MYHRRLQGNRSCGLNGIEPGDRNDSRRAVWSGGFFCALRGLLKIWQENGFSLD